MSSDVKKLDMLAHTANLGRLRLFVPIDICKCMFTGRHSKIIQPLTLACIDCVSEDSGNGCPIQRIWQQYCWWYSRSFVPGCINRNWSNIHTAGHYNCNKHYLLTSLYNNLSWFLPIIAQCWVTAFLKSCDSTKPLVMHRKIPIPSSDLRWSTWQYCWEAKVFKALR